MLLLLDRSLDLDQTFHGDSVDIVDSNKAYIKIVHQPQDYFRFRYLSERPSHGSIRSREKNKFPTVQLVNYEEDAFIACCLVEESEPYRIHPHQLVVDSNTKPVGYDEGVIVQVNKKTRTAIFAGIGIQQTAKKDLSAFVDRQKKNTINNVGDMKEELKRLQDVLNVVRLRFTAYNGKTYDPITEPVYSNCIHNHKSAKTNDLKICRISRVKGNIKGNDEMFLLVEKVIKESIEVWFVEESIGWQAQASFSTSDVHHQYAIVVRTPSFINTKSETDVEVRIELRRTTDKHRSNQFKFTYKADPLYARKRRKNSDTFMYSTSEDIETLRSEVLSEDFLDNIVLDDVLLSQSVNEQVDQCAMDYLENIWNEMPRPQMDIGEYNRDEPDVNSPVKRAMRMKRHTTDGPEVLHGGPEIALESVRKPDQEKYIQFVLEKLFYFIKKGQYWKLKSELVRLMDIRLTNRDTCLHQLLRKGQAKPVFRHLVWMLHVNDLTPMLNTRNADEQCLLHVAVEMNLGSCVTILLDFGADQQLQDKKGNTPLHLAVFYQRCLDELLKHDTAKQCFNITNEDGMSPITIACQNNDCGAVSKMLDIEPVVPENGRNILHIAVGSGNCDMLTLLLERIKNIDKLINEVDDRYNAEPLSLCKDQIMRKLLIDKGAKEKVFSSADVSIKVEHLEESDDEYFSERDSETEEVTNSKFEHLQQLEKLNIEK